MDDDARAFGVACLVFVELVTDYLDDALDPPRHAAMTAHLRTCPDCGEYLAQIRATISATGRLRAEAFDPRIMADLVTEFHHLLGAETHRSIERP